MPRMRTSAWSSYLCVVTFALAVHLVFSCRDWLYSVFLFCCSGWCDTRSRTLAHNYSPQNLHKRLHKCRHVTALCFVIVRRIYTWYIETKMAETVWCAWSSCPGQRVVSRLTISCRRTSPNYTHTHMPHTIYLFGNAQAGMPHWGHLHAWNIFVAIIMHLLQLFILSSFAGTGCSLFSYSAAVAGVIYTRSWT